MHPAGLVALTRLQPAAIDHHGRHLRRLTVGTGQATLLVGLDLGIAETHPLPADAPGELAEVTGAQGHRQEFAEVVGRVLPGGGFGGLADGLAQDRQAVTLGAQGQSLIEGGKKGDDKAYISTAAAATRPPR